jgi:hypothetical protein
MIKEIVTLAGGGGGGIQICQIRPTTSANCWASGAAPSMVGAVNGQIHRCATGPRRGSGATEQPSRGEALRVIDSPGHT